MILIFERIILNLNPFLKENFFRDPTFVNIIYLILKNSLKWFVFAPNVLVFYAKKM